MKRSELAFNFLLLPIDILMILLSFILAYKFQIQRVNISFLWPFAEYIKFILFFVPVWITVFTLEGLYNIRERRQGIDEIAGIILAVTSSTMVVMAWFFLSKTVFFSRAIILYTWIFAMIFVTLARWIIRTVQKYLYKYGVGVHRLIIVGNNNYTEDILKEIQGNPDLGYKLIGMVKTGENGFKKDNTKVLGKAEDLEKIIEKNPIDDLILADPHISEAQTVKIIDVCQDRKITVKQMPNFYQVQTTNVSVTALAGIPIVEFLTTPLEGWGRISKRFFDIVSSGIAIMVTSPIMLLTAILIKVDSPGPILYKNQRVGENGKKFYAYKFRSMKSEFCTGDEYGGKKAEQYEKKLIIEKSERLGPVYKILGDPRRTKFGRFIERTSLDEFPQFFNVFLGHISMVGPRPHQPREVEGYQQWQRKVLRIKPGITGMAQVSGRSDLDFDDEARLDIYYIENWSLWLDTKILLKTPLAILKPRKSV